MSAAGNDAPIQRQGTLWSLQYLRGIAALLVVYFHTVLQIGTLAPAGTVFVQTGSSGVDVFFVLSGFVMWTSTMRDADRNPWSFYRRRILRVVPLYWVVTLFAAGIALAAPSLVRSIAVRPDHLLASLFFVPYANPAFPPPTHPNHLTPLIVPGWTLNFEMFFYLLFGAVLALTPRARLAALGGAFLLLVVAAALIRPEPDVLAFYASGYLIEFLLGTLVAIAAARSHLPPRPAAIGMVAVGGIALLVVEAAGWATPIREGISAALIVYGAVAVERSMRLPHSIALLELGNASYSLYLVHGLVLSAIRAVWQRIGPGLDRPGTQIAYMLVCLLAGVAAGWLVHRAVEQPLLRAMRRRPPA